MQLLLFKNAQSKKQLQLLDSSLCLTTAVNLPVRIMNFFNLLEILFAMHKIRRHIESTFIAFSKLTTTRSEFSIDLIKADLSLSQSSVVRSPLKVRIAVSFDCSNIRFSNFSVLITHRIRIPSYCYSSMTELLNPNEKITSFPVQDNQQNAYYHDNCKYNFLESF